MICAICLTKMDRDINRGGVQSEERGPNEEGTQCEGWGVRVGGAGTEEGYQQLGVYLEGGDTSS